MKGKGDAWAKGKGLTVGKLSRLGLLQHPIDLRRRPLHRNLQHGLVRLVLPPRKHAHHLARDPEVARRGGSIEGVRQRLEHARGDPERVVVKELEASPEGDADLLGDARVLRGVLCEERLEDAPDLLARPGARWRESVGEPVDDGEEHVDPLEGVAREAELGARRGRRLDRDGVDDLDVGHAE